MVVVGVIYGLSMLKTLNIISQSINQFYDLLFHVQRYINHKLCLCFQLISKLIFVKASQQSLPSMLMVCMLLKIMTCYVNFLIDDITWPARNHVISIISIFQLNLWSCGMAPMVEELTNCLWTRFVWCVTSSPLWLVLPFVPLFSLTQIPPIDPSVKNDLAPILQMVYELVIQILENCISH